MYDDVPDVVITSIHERLTELGLDVTREQVREVDEWAYRWERGRMTLVELCRRSGWPLPRDAEGEPGEVLAYYVQMGLEHARRQRPAQGTVERVEAVAADMASLRQLRSQLADEMRDSLVAADRAGHDENGEPVRGHREKLVRASKPGLSRAGVFKQLGAADTLAAAQQALKPMWTSAKPTWSSAPRARLFSLVQLGESVVLRLDQDSSADPGIHNMAVTMLEVLREAGLGVSSDGPHDRVLEDLIHGHDVTVTRKS